MSDDRNDVDAQGIRRDVQDEPLETGPHGEPQAPDPQAGLVSDDDSREPDSARPLHPRTGEPFGP
ncbi:MAG: hypothetical protein ACJ77B_01555 [Chloroflexota bacterium]